MHFYSSTKLLFTPNLYYHACFVSICTGQLFPKPLVIPIDDAGMTSSSFKHQAKGNKVTSVESIFYSQRERARKAVHAHSHCIDCDWESAHHSELNRAHCLLVPASSSLTLGGNEACEKERQTETEVQLKVSQIRKSPKIQVRSVY